MSLQWRDESHVVYDEHPPARHFEPAREGDSHELLLLLTIALWAVVWIVTGVHALLQWLGWWQ